MAQVSTLPARTNGEPNTLRGQLAKMQPEFAKALPGHISPERFVRTAQTAVAMTRNIDKVKNPASLMAACTKAAADGLILDGREAALVVDYNGDVQYRPMMRGLLKLAYNSGQIKSIVVEIARDKDHFTYEPTNPDKPIHHEINVRAPRGEPFAVYAIATLKDGGIIHDVMTVEDINRIRDRSDAFKAYKAGKIKSTPWHTDWSEMARKTVFRRMSKYLPSSSDRDALHQAVERIDEDYSFEAEANPATGEVSTPRPAQKQRGGAAAALKNVTPAKPANGKAQRAHPKPEPELPPEAFANDPPSDDEPTDHDPETGDDPQQGPGDDI